MPKNGELLKAVTTNSGQVVGWIYGVYGERGAYHGSFFVQRKVIPADTVGHVRKLGINDHLIPRGDTAPREWVSCLSV